MAYSISSIIGGLESQVASSPHPSAAQTVAQGATGKVNGNSPTVSNMTSVYAGATFVVVALLTLWVGGGIVLKGL